MNLAEENIKNLTSMWRLVNENMKSHHIDSHYEYGLEKAIEVINNSSTEIIIPYWDININLYHKTFEKYGFEKKLEQTGMCLKLRESLKSFSTLTLEKVDNNTKAKQWEKLFEKAFNYNIAERVITANQNDLDFFIASHNGESIGTALLYSHNKDIIGIHSMGIIPNKRIQGFAKQMMIHLINQSIEKGFKYATLQSSKLGKNLYLKLGFKEQFTLTSYHIKQQNINI